MAPRDQWCLVDEHLIVIKITAKNDLDHRRERYSWAFVRLKSHASQLDGVSLADECVSKQQRGYENEPRTWGHGVIPCPQYTLRTRLTSPATDSLQCPGSPGIFDQKSLMSRPKEPKQQNPKLKQKIEWYQRPPQPNKLITGIPKPPNSH